MKKFFLYFGFNRIEQRGFLVFTAFMLLIVFLPHFILLFKKQAPQEYALFYFEPTGVQPKQGSPVDHYSVYPKHSPNSPTLANAASYFFFDPNNLADSSWIKLGFSPKQIKVIKNYEAKGGTFLRKEDVAKIYVISTKEYNRIAPYIRITPNRKGKDIAFAPFPDNKKISNASVHLTIDINTADTIAWKSL